MGDDSHDRLLASIHYIYPTVVFTYFAITSAVAACTLQTTSDLPNPQHRRPRSIVGLLLLFNVLYLVQLVAEVVEAIIQQQWPAPHAVVGLLSCMLVFGIQQTTLGSGASGIVWFPFYGSWLIALVAEPAIAAITILSTVHKPDHSSIHLWVNVAIAAARYLVLALTAIVYFVWRARPEETNKDDESNPLLPKSGDRSSEGNCSGDSGYGTNSEGNTEATNSPSDGESPWERQEREAREKVEKRLKSEGSWVAYAKGFLVFFPYVWPVGNGRLQFHAALVGLCLILGNVVNVLIPRQLGIVMDTLSGKEAGRSPWVEVVIFASLKLASSEAGISLLRNMLWLPVDYYAIEALSNAAYSHVMRLSSDFHDSQSSSDLILAISSGHHISNMLESICFQALPMVVDLVVAFIYLSVKFGAYEGFITIATGVAFTQAATYIVGMFKDRRNKMVKTYFEEHYVRQAGIQGWHTVSAFNQIPYEEDRYATAINSKVSSLKMLFSGYYVGHAFQYLILLCGLLAGAFLAVYQVKHGQATAGDFVMFLTYWAQLTSPLHFFATLGKSISQDLVYAERLLEVMQAKATVVDKPDAKPINLRGAKVEFRNLRQEEGHLEGCEAGSTPPGSSAAFVGATGAGKSTILKLLDRFYDVTSGSILIDGQDIRDVQLSSLRQSMGIVPQAPILFDDTIINNIRYGRHTASDEEIYEACKVAAIHDHVMGFSEGYKTRLSGGELQRIAIARAILKRPDIVLLDEATSSVDTETEQKIQGGLHALCEGRTTFIVAHRLSTVMNADTIFVVSDGEIAEQGSHDELLKRKGKYAELWSKQIFAKPKELKGSKDSEHRDETDQQIKSAASDASQSTPDSDKQPPLESQKPVITPLRRPINTPKLDTTTKDSQASNDQTTRTPRGHKKEGSKLNPGAPEFTPRSATTPVRNVAAADRCSWADDVQAAADKQSHTVTSPIFDITSSGDQIHNEPEHITPKHAGLKQMDGSPDVQTVPGYRLPEPQDTSRSVSDPVHEQPPNTPSTPTPTKSEPPLKKTPTQIGATQNGSARRDARPHHPSAAQNVSTHGDVRQNNMSGHQQDAASGSRGRGQQNRQHQRGGTRGRGRRYTSNTHRRGESVAATSSSAKQP
ncbi:Heavy metal tolerance protein [Apiospora saccharicola]|uniref:Heavy metal tolerance protein n=1 Tax=Apiospora saccharicola TaxID=335842 RepID=A0ABR1WK79_9PEZI